MKKNKWDRFLNLILILIAILYGSYVFMKLWEWFIAPIFNISITLIQSIAIIFIYGLLNKMAAEGICGLLNKMVAEEEHEGDLTIKQFVKIIVYYQVILIFGWILTLL